MGARQNTAHHNNERFSIGGIWCLPGRRRLHRRALRITCGRRDSPGHLRLRRRHAQHSMLREREADEAAEAGKGTATSIVFHKSYTPWPLHLAHWTLHPGPWTLHPGPWTLHPTP